MAPTRWTACMVSWTARNASVRYFLFFIGNLREVTVFYERFQLARRQTEQMAGGLAELIEFGERKIRLAVFRKSIYDESASSFSKGHYDPIPSRSSLAGPGDALLDD